MLTDHTCSRRSSEQDKDPNITYVWNIKKYGTTEHIHKMNKVTYVESKRMVTKGERRVGKLRD